MSTVLTADNSTLLSQISSKVCQAIIAIQVQQPELLLEKYREIPWQSSRHQSGLVNKLIEILGQTQDEKVTQQLLQKFLRALLAPESFSSPILISLFKEVSQLTSKVKNDQVVSQAPALVNGLGTTTSSENSITSVPETESKSVSIEPPPTSTTDTHLDAVETGNFNSNASQVLIADEESKDSKENVEDITPDTSTQISETTKDTSGATDNALREQDEVAILLLDAENLQFNSETEKFLSSVCNYPIQVKVAFANRCRKGKLDAELHARNYDLIHVPSGRDNADGKMITFGSSINQRFPNAKEVFVCSSDNVMTNLCNHMMQNGLNVFRVVKQGSNLTVLDIQSGQTHVHTVLPTIEQFITQIKDIIREEESRTANQWMKLSKISKIFHNKYNIGVNQVVSHHFRGKTAKDIFVEHAEFAVHHLPEDSETFIALFKLPQANR